MSSSDIKEINEHILEIRYKPNSKILDFRGNITEKISQHMNLSEWQIGENRIDVFKKDQSFRAFVAFRNSGIVIRNTSLPDYFPNQAVKFVRYLFSLETMANPVFVERLGVKSKFSIPYKGSFSELFENFKNKLIHLSDEALAAYDAEIIDVGFPLNFKTIRGNINTNCGPMKKDQLKLFFDHEKEEELPEVGIYIDFDYWIKPSKPISVKELCDYIKDYSNENWQRRDRIHSLIQK